jgi:hypothetical protein
MPMSAAVRLAQRLQDLSPAEMAALSDRAGVQRKIGAGARAGRKIAATAYMLLCAAAGIDAATGAPAMVVTRAGATIVWWMFGSGLFLTRTIKRLDLRVAANLVGVSAATLSRAERCQPVAVVSFLRISDFIGIPAESFLCFTENTNCNTLKVKEPADARLHRLVTAAPR